MRYLALCVVLCLSLISQTCGYLIGSGIADITGPLVEQNMMGYGEFGQNTHGLHLRLRARTFIFVDEKEDKRVAFVNVDLQSCMHSIKQTVVSHLEEVYQGLYHDKNVLISAIHTHSGPGGYSWDALYQITSLGFSNNNMDVIVNGIISSLADAHSNLKPSRMTINKDILSGAGINRSLWSYLLNPEEERARYSSDTDNTFTTIRIEDKETGKATGMMNFFAVHGTSMNKTNLLVSSDNKGYAAYRFEKYMNGPNSKSGNGPFVAVFANSNAGDISPNIRGASCTKDGSECDFRTSSCKGFGNECVASGPGQDMFDSVRIIGEKQFRKALDKFQDLNDQQEISGPIDYMHAYVDLGKYVVGPEFTSTKKSESTCPPAGGDSFPAGTTDGTGFPFFKQGHVSPGNLLLNELLRVVFHYDDGLKQCQKPKPIFVNFDKDLIGIPIVTRIQPFQLIRIGSLFLVAVPTELTSMAGRRLRETVENALRKQGIDNAHVVISGYANSYAMYTTTPEEYTGQRYEGGATFFGQQQLPAYQQLFTRMVSSMLGNATMPSEPAPPPSKEISFHPPVVIDTHPPFKGFGKVSKEPKEQYSAGDLIVAEFIGSDLDVCFSAYPTACNNVSYIERLVGDQWEVVADDGDWETRLHWHRHLIAQSRITVEWFTPETTLSGIYRITLNAFAKTCLHRGSHKHYVGHTRSFQILGHSDTAHVKTNPSEQHHYHD